MTEEGRLARVLLNHKNHLRRLKEAITNPVRATEAEKERVRKLTEVERYWWSETKPYESVAEITDDFNSGKLTRIESNPNFKLIMRFVNPDLEDWQPYLMGGATLLLYEITERWRQAMDNTGLSKTIRLSITSLVRTASYQIKIIEMGKLAMFDSTHTKGQAFDIDGCGYYDGEQNINPRQELNYWALYNPLVHKLLEQLLEDMRREGKLNYVTEYKGTTNQCFHVTRHPQYEP